MIAFLIAACTSAPVPPPPSTENEPSIEGSSPLPSTAANGGSAALLPGDPNPAFTPGAKNPVVTQATIHSTICVAGWTATVRPPSTYTTALKAQQIPEYGYANTTLADYEEDHLISLEIGGAPRSQANLWPEPYSVTLADGRSVGARVKDQFENRLHDLVCAGQMTLTVAQNEIAHDWIRHWFALSGQAPPPESPATTTSPSGEPAATPSGTAAPPPSDIPLKIVRLTSPVPRGHVATASASTAPGAVCSILVVYKSGPSSATGLGDKTASASGSVSWTWRVGTRTTVGTWPVTITCSVGDATASQTKAFRVI